LILIYNGNIIAGFEVPDTLLAYNIATAEIDTKNHWLTNTDIEILWTVLGRDKETIMASSGLVS